MDRIYGGGRWFDERYFKAKRVMLSLTTGGGPGPFSEGEITGDIYTHLYSINYGIFRFVGFGVSPALRRLGPSAHLRGAPERQYRAICRARPLHPQNGTDRLSPLERLRPRTLRLKADE